MHTRSRSGDSPLYLATYRKLTTDDCDDTGLLKHLIELGCGVNEQNEAGLTPLHLCAWKGNPNLISFLLSHGADPCVRNRQGATPASLARLQGNKQAEELLQRTEEEWIVHHSASANQ
ncbi:ankyrin repeat and protein kinase domain-containing protein 1-like [Ixodes scapularis]